MLQKRVVKEIYGILSEKKKKSLFLQKGMLSK